MLRAATGAAAVVTVVLVWLLSGWLFDRFDRAPASTAGAAVKSAPTVSLPPLKPGDHRPQTVSPPAGGAARADERAAVARKLSRAVARAEALGGSAEAAVLAEGWDAPVTAGDARRQVRMWSMSKPLAAVTALIAAERPSPALLSAMTSAITRSENCPQRRVVLGLQTLAGGPAKAREALDDTLARAKAHARIATSAPPPEAACQAYLSQAGIANPGGGALTLGTSTWTVTDATRFAFALGTGEYGKAGDTVLGLMRRTKQPSTELSSPDEYTATPAWGAGRVFAKPAYKAGWGGVQQQRFVAGQLAIVTIDHRTYAIAAYFHPDVQPPIDDPGRTPAPQAIETIFKALQ